MYQQTDDIQKICAAWIAQVLAGRRPGKQFLQKDQNGKWGFSVQHGQLLSEYIQAHSNNFVSPEALDKAIYYLTKSDRLQAAGQKTEPIDRDISRGTTNKSSEISFESTGGIRAIVEKYLKARAAVDESRDKQEAERKKEFVPLPRRELTQKEMHDASVQQLKEWNRWNNGSAERTGGDIR